MSTNPFLTQTTKPFVVIKGARAGYIQLATSEEIIHYNQLPNELFQAAKTWAALLENQGAKRVYWLTLSEVVTHLHIHLYPRWSDDEPKGIPLFEDRNAPNQPEWPTELKAELNKWAREHQVYLIEGQKPSFF